MTFSLEICSQLCKLGMYTTPQTFFINRFAFRGPVHIRHDTQVICSSIDCFSFISDHTLFRTSKIGRYSSIAEYVSMGLGQHDIYDFSTSNVFCNSHNFDFAGYHTERLSPLQAARNNVDTAHVIIGNDVWVGAHVVFPKDVTVGHGAVIGSGAVITKDVPPYAVVVGNNRIIKQRFSDEIIADMLELNWWDYNLPEMIKQGLEIPYSDPKAFIERFKQIDPQDLIEFPKEWYDFNLGQDSAKEVKIHTIQEPFSIY